MKVAVTIQAYGNRSSELPEEVVSELGERVHECLTSFDVEDLVVTINLGKKISREEK